MDDDRIIDLPEVAGLLRAETATVMRLARSGQLPGTRIGNTWLFMRTDVLEFLRNQIALETEARRQHAMETSKATATAVLLPGTTGKRRTKLPTLPTVPVVPVAGSYHK